MMHRKQLCPGLLLIIYQLLTLGVQARPLIPVTAPTYEDLKHVPVGLTHVQRPDMSSEREALFDMSAQIGSRPPSCQNKCNSCSPCQAVQVPTPQDRRSGQGPTPSEGQLMSEYANYKPEGWKCKCGNRLFNP
ncbi:hypothetical protein O6H91_06G052200 [Diphasiastrum complanatum]|uniref:Uncharacterized protein n=1 Tax=Diphasiastrum complanatum TaxID=34168 RepID=A0ACC2DDK1_DIPCM|nr:hypothetical protein O6H91_06G052200 [Diphasiastrum complanatum]